MDCLVHAGQYTLVAIILLIGIKAYLSYRGQREKLDSLELLSQGKREGRRPWMAERIRDSVLVTFAQEFESAAFAGPALGDGLVWQAHC